MKKILVIQTAFIGDAILATAVIEKLHQFYPNAQLFFLVRKGNESLFVGHPFIYETLVWNKSEGKYKSLLNILKRVRKEKFDLLINLHRHLSSGIITVFSKAIKTIGFNKNPLSFLFTQSKEHIIGKGIHEVDRNQSLIQSVTNELASKPKLYPKEIHDNKVKEFKIEDYSCIAPASVWFTKQWPEQKWSELCNLIKDKKIYLLGAAADNVLCERIVSASLNKNVVSLAGKLNFLESASLMRDAKMNYVNDSGPMHLASAVNGPVTSIYCSTVPEFGFYPLSIEVKIIETEEKLACRPCGLHGYKTCPEGHFKCGLGILVEDVLKEK